MWSESKGFLCGRYRDLGSGLRYYTSYILHISFKFSFLSRCTHISLPEVATMPALSDAEYHAIVKIRDLQKGKKFWGETFDKFMAQFPACGHTSNGVQLKSRFQRYELKLKKLQASGIL